MHLIIPKNYNPVLNLRDTEIAIKLVKDFFETELARALNLTRVSAPIMVTPGSGLNDNLNGVERPVSFDVLETGETAEIVHSLAKWKRQALKTYGFQPGEGLYTDMNAIRRDETTDNIHSIFVDQWDWEKIITPKQRTMETLQATVRAIYLTLRKTEGFVCAHYPHIKPEAARRHHVRLVAGIGGFVSRPAAEGTRIPGGTRIRRCVPDGHRRCAAFRTDARRPRPRLRRLVTQR